jgi:hypothetical protein
MLEQRRAMMAQWASFLLGSEARPDNVIELENAT